MQGQYHPAVSVIVPVYKAENTIHRCVDSLLNQTLQDIEIILVDDGSPDNSGLIIDEYAKKDPRIKALHERNRGVGTARNLGMSVATGEYVGFVDSDDWVQRNMYEMLYTTMCQTHSDITFTGYQKVHFGRVVGDFEQTHHEITLSDEGDLFAYRRHFFGRGTDKDESPIQGFVWNACFRKQFVDRWHLKFTNQMMEDMLFVLEACQRAESIALQPGEPYCYRFCEQPSRISTFNHRTIDDFREHLISTKQLIEREPIQFQSESRMRWNRQVIDSCRSLTHLIEASSCSNKKKREYIERIFSAPMLKDACTQYDARAFHLFDRLFYYCEKKHLVMPARCMMDTWIAVAPLIHRVRWDSNR